MMSSESTKRRRPCFVAQMDRSAWIYPQRYDSYPIESGLSEDHDIVSRGGTEILVKKIIS